MKENLNEHLKYLQGYFDATIIGYGNAHGIAPVVLAHGLSELVRSEVQRGGETDQVPVLPENTPKSLLKRGKVEVAHVPPNGKTRAVRKNKSGQPRKQRKKMSAQAIENMRKARWGNKTEVKLDHTQATKNMDQSPA